MKKIDRVVSITLVTVCSLLLFSLMTYGALTKNYTFVAGTVIASAEVNSNFDQLFSAIGTMEYNGHYLTNNDSITTSLTNLDTQVYSSVTEIASNKGKITMVTNDGFGLRVLTDVLDQNTVTFDATTHKIKVNEGYSFLPRGYISGVTLTNHGTTSLDVSIGVARTTDDAYNIRLSSAIRKNLAVARTGDGSTAPGGLDTGAIAANTGYHVWLYKHKTWTTGDVIFSTSGTAPSLPTYSVGRRIGWVTTDNSSHIKTFDQLGNYFWWKNPEICIKDAAVSNAASTTFTLPLPSDVRVRANLALYVDSTTGRGIHIFPTSQTDIEPSAGALTDTPLFDAFAASPSGGTISNGTGNVNVVTDKNRQIKARSRGGSSGLYAVIRGWEDMRGQED